MATASEQRQALIDLNTLARRDLFALWRQLNVLNPAETAGALRDLLPALGDTYGSAAASLAADWYDELRAAADAGGTFTAVPAEDVENARWTSLAGWATQPLEGQPDPTAAYLRLAGGLQRTIADRHRLTIVDNTSRDKAAHGWQRIGVGANCPFCTMLIGRGAVYTSSTVTFKSHDHCNCVASPAFEPGRLVGTVAFKASKRNQSPADKARVREYLSSGKAPEPGPARGTSGRSLGFDSLTTDELKHQIGVLEKLPDTEYKAKQLARCRARLAELGSQ